MSARGCLLLCLWFSLVPWSTRLAAEAGGAALEIAYLLGAVETSECEFQRNGSWFNGTQAAAHLRKKYRWLEAAGRIDTAEDFIDKVASSSFSGRPYALRCAGGIQISSALWLREALGSYRARPAPSTITPSAITPRT